jgi:NADH-quinone oxidoreductase subunit L
MPTTFWTFIVGSLALAGIPPLAGFFSKDEILLGASANHYPLMLAAGLVGAFMTAAYMTRACCLIFAGEYRGHGHPHESPRSMTVPLQLLGVLSILVGLLGTGLAGKLRFSHWVPTEVVEMARVPEHAFSPPLALVSVTVAVIGIGVAAGYYLRNLGPHGLTARSGPARAGYRLLVNKYYLDRIYVDGVIRAIQYPIARAAYWFNQHVIDGVVNGAGSGARRAGQVVYDVLDQKVVDGLVNGAGLTAEEGGAVLRTMQTGRVQQYAAVLFAAVAVFAAALVFLT